MNKVVGAKDKETGGIEWHASASSVGNYHTLCGLSLDDDQFDPVELVDCNN